MDVILIPNDGSSSLELQIFAFGSAEPERLIKGQIDGISVHPRFRATGTNGEGHIDQTCSATDIPGLPAATLTLLNWLVAREGMALRAIGHRAVHGGQEHAAPVRIDPDVLKDL